VSEDIAEYLTESYGVPRDKISITRNGIDTARFRRTKERVRSNVIHVSRIDRGRSLTAFLICDIAEDFIAKHPEARFIIAGDGDDFHSLKKRANEINRSIGREAILLFGALSDVRPLLDSGGIFIGVSRAAMEAMAMELPTIISGDEGYGGIICKENIEELTKSNLCARGSRGATKDVLLEDLLCLYENEDLQNSLSESSKKVIDERFSAEKMTDDAVSVYRCALHPTSVCLLGYFGYGNLGDEEALRAARTAFFERGIKKTSVLVPKRLADEERNFINRLSPIALYRALKDSDALVLTGGNLLQNETSLRSLLYYYSVIILSHSLGKRIYMIGSGFGEIYGRTAGRLFASALGKASFIGARTGCDLDMARCAAPSVPSALMPDLCFLLPAKRGIGSKKYFAIIGATREFFESVEIEKIKKEHALTPIVIMLFPDADESASEAFANRHGIELFAPRTYGEILSRLLGCKFTISERLHGAVFSLLSGVPSYLCDVRLKNRALIDEIKKRAEALGSASPLLPYSLKRRDIKKEEIEAKRFDFPGIIASLSGDARRVLDLIFTQPS
jgi:hypothetical protein